jgi:flavin-dependent dehydrogenase
MPEKVVVIGGGLSGLTSAILLARNNFHVTLVEKKSYPFHRVCGEYVSNEVIPFLHSIGIVPESLNPSRIEEFQLTSVTGRSCSMKLDLGGFGISRFRFDHFMYEAARKEGVVFYTGTTAEKLHFEHDRHFIKLNSGKELESSLVIGAHGKNSRIDHLLERRFIRNRSPFLAVKYHIEYDFPHDRIALHNFPGGYCGTVRIEDGKYNLCYLASRNLLKKAGEIRELEERFLCINPFLRDIFHNAKFHDRRPLVINEFSFWPKGPVGQNVLMAGDAAGMITPLCGNGMAMAIHSAKILSETIIKYCTKTSLNRDLINLQYSRQWRKTFQLRLWTGRQVQKLFGGNMGSGLAVGLMNTSAGIAEVIMKKTHGRPF